MLTTLLTKTRSFLSNIASPRPLPNSSGFCPACHHRFGTFDEYDDGHCNRCGWDWLDAVTAADPNWEDEYAAEAATWKAECELADTYEALRRERGW